MDAPRRTGFTLVEMLVVVAIIALLLSLLLPALGRARELVKTTVCLSDLRQIGVGFVAYTTDFRGLFPPADTRPGPGVDIDKNSWATSLVVHGLIDAPRATDPNTPVKSAFTCPSLPKMGDAQRSDAGGSDWYVFNGYGANGTTDTFAGGWGSMGWPFWGVGANGWRPLKVWLDPEYRMGRVTDPSRFIAYYDGTWMNHVPRPDRVHPRHMFTEKTNVVVFDASAHSIDYDALSNVYLPTDSSGPVIWRNLRGW